MLCKPCTSCTTYNIDKVRDILERIDSNIFCMSTPVYKYYKQGTGQLIGKQFEYDQLKTFQKSLNRHYERLLNNFEPVVPIVSINSLIERIKRIIGGFNCCNDTDIEYKNFRYSNQLDDSNFTEWEKTNPFCVPMEIWQKYAPEVFQIQGVEVEITTQTCKLAAYVVADIVSCDIIPLFSAITEQCKLDTTFEITTEECKLELELLKTEINCDLDVTLYAELRRCNLTPTLIGKTYELGGYFRAGPNNTLYMCVNDIELPLD